MWYPRDIGACGIGRVRALAFGDAYPARTALLERVTQVDLDRDRRHRRVNARYDRRERSGLGQPDRVAGQVDPLVAEHHGLDVRRSLVAAELHVVAR